ncbi:hypothetical protein [Streptomyces sporangiiformans]|nr:hypothetical protein [Streptomyces sporangiiformans]
MPTALAYAASAALLLTACSGGDDSSSDDINGELPVFAPKATLFAKNTKAQLSYCTDESKAATKNRETGKVVGNPRGTDPKVFYTVTMQKSTQGVWQAVSTASPEDRIPGPPGELEAARGTKMAGRADQRARRDRPGARSGVSSPLLRPPRPDRQGIMPDINECQICGTTAPPVPGQCEEVTGYRLIRNPWSREPSFLDGNLHFSCLEESDESAEFFDEFTRMLQAGHEEIESLDGSLPPLTRMGLGMTQIFAGSECCIFQSGVSDRWMVVKRTGPWFHLRHADLLAIASGTSPKSPAAVIPYRLPIDPGSEVGEWSLPELLAALGVEDRYAATANLEGVEYEVVDYYPPKHLLEYVAAAPLPIPDEARAFLASHAETYTPVSFEDEQDS